LKKLAHTPNSQIKSALRKLWLRSRERAAAIKRDKYTCQKCGAKQSRAKGKEVYVEVHHKSGRITNWDEIYKAVRKHLLCDKENLETLCACCHQKTQEKEWAENSVKNTETK
jgi:5-methylcytosine-specific restriction endonuclease McrA